LVAVLFFHYNIASIPLTFLAHGRWFSPGTPASSTTKTGRHDIDEILLKVALNTKNQINLLKNRHICNRRIIETQ
jgi:hypothetical protein